MSMGVIPTIAPYLLPIILPTLEDRHPTLQLAIDEDQSQPLVDRVMSGELDTAIIALPYNCPGLLTFPFWNEDFYYVVHRDDASAVEGTINPEDIELSRLMLLKEGHCLKEHALAVCGLSNEARVSTRGTSLNTVVQLVLGRFGSTLVPEIALPHLVTTNPDLVWARLNEEGPHRSLAFVVRPNYPGLHNIEQLKNLLCEQLQQGRACLIDRSEKTNAAI
ncbi:MAG: LysR substrate-binding domain-containing protein, partial [Pseudomonadota bacterium]